MSESNNETAAKQEDLLNNEEINKASREFSVLVPKIKAMSRNLNARGVARVMSAVIEFPLGQDYPKFRSREEQELFMMSLHALGCKETMTQYWLKDQARMEEIKKQVTDNVVSELLKTKENSDELETNRQSKEE